MTTRDRQRMSAFAAELASREAALRASYLTDPGALELAEHQRRMRESIEAELQADQERQGRTCAGASLSLFD